jgi:hypothetical protein
MQLEQRKQQPPSMGLLLLLLPPPHQLPVSPKVCLVLLLLVITINMPLYCTINLPLYCRIVALVSHNLVQESLSNRSLSSLSSLSSLACWLVCTSCLCYPCRIHCICRCICHCWPFCWVLRWGQYQHHILILSHQSLC